jgi:hypothetical protein
MSVHSKLFLHTKEKNMCFYAIQWYKYKKNEEMYLISSFILWNVHQCVEKRTLEAHKHVIGLKHGICEWKIFRFNTILMEWNDGSNSTEWNICGNSYWKHLHKWTYKIHKKAHYSPHFPCVTTYSIRYNWILNGEYDHLGENFLLHYLD